MQLRPYYWFGEFDQYERDRRRWFKSTPSWNGPIKQAYVRVIGTSDVIDITNPSDRYRIKDLDLSDVIGVATQYPNGVWNARHERPDCPNSEVHLYGHYATLELVEEAIRRSYKTHVDEETRIGRKTNLSGV